MMERLMQVEPRLLGALFATLLAAVCAVGWQFLLRQPVAEYRELRAARAGLQRDMAEHGRQSAPVAGQDAAHALQSRLAALVVTGAPDAAALELIRKLDALCERNGVRLMAVKPGAPRAAGLFRELPVDVEALGSYADLHRWLREAESELGAFYVVEFAIRPAAGTGQLALQVKLNGLTEPEGGAA